MLSKESAPLIEASVPVLREHGVSITSLFYQNMLSAHPELKNLFNMSNQAGGEQQLALANAVYAYAANFKNPDALSPILNRIAHKHASLGITPAQYTIVGKYLLSAIAEVLGEAANDALLSAWDEAYWLLACDLVARESALYFQKNVLASEVWQNLVVVERVQENNEVVSLYLQTPDFNSPGDFIPGQYVSVAGNVEALQHQQIRQYSLSNSPQQNVWRISIKRESETKQKPAGLISNELHKLNIGDSLKVSPAYGDFCLEKSSKKPIVLITAGIGITPALSILNDLKDTEHANHIMFIHAADKQSDQLFSEEISSIKQALSNFEDYYFYQHIDKEEAHIFPGLFDLSTMPGKPFIPEADFYLCGPLPFMKDVRRQLLENSVKVENIHYEVFGPDLFASLD